MPPAVYVTKHRTLREIELDMSNIITKVPQNAKEAQFIRDLERLIVAMRMSPAYERGE